tara:strand:+ start:492 stop:782 length:291 start_codon:yes stop_codon:yes gene_type:complete
MKDSPTRNKYAGQQALFIKNISAHQGNSSSHQLIIQGLGACPHNPRAVIASIVLKETQQSKPQNSIGSLSRKPEDGITPLLGLNLHQIDNHGRHMV